MITLNATSRDVKVNPKMVRKEGNIPAVFYGPGQQSTPIAVEKAKFLKVLEEAGESTVIQLVTEKGKLDVLVHEVELDPVMGDPIHIDFYVVAKDRKVHVEIPIEYIGTSPAEKVGGVVLKVMHEINVEALPGALPQSIVVDLSTLLEIGSDFTIGSLTLPEGVRAMGGAEEVIASIAAPTKEEEVVSVATPDLAAIEVEKKGKKEDEETAE